jgi:hypothetical protein
MARSAKVQPTAINSSFMPRAEINNSRGCLAVADNWGANGLAAGMVNFVVCGVEE